MAALAGRMGGGAAAKGPQEKVHHDRVSLFDPTRLFDFMNILCWPMRILHYLLWPLLALSIFIIAKHYELYSEDLRSVDFTWSAVASALVTLFVANLTARLAQGTVIRHFGGEVHEFGIIIELGILPRFFVDKSAIPRLSRTGQLWAYGSSLVSRLWLYAGGTLMWLATHGSGSSVSLFMLVVSQAALMEFLIIAFPLMPADGMNWITTYFGDPHLKKKAILALKHWFTGKARHPFVKEEEEGALILFGIGTVLCSLLFVFCLLLFFSITMERSFGAAGVVMGLLLCGSCALWFVGMWKQRGKARTGGAGLALDPEILAGLAGAAKAKTKAAEAEKPQTRTSYAAWSRIFWSALICFLIAVACLPYNYETSGQFTILPNARNQATARTDGEIMKVLVREGDWVSENQILGELSNWDQQHDVAITSANLAAAKAKLAQLEEGAKSEEIIVAEKQVESSKASVAFSEAEMKRQMELAKTGTASQAALDKAKSKYDSDVASLQVAIANLDLVRSSATQSQLDASKAEVDKLTAELKYRDDLLERTRVRAPAEGRIITPNPQLLVGKWLKSGEALMETENTRNVDAEVDVPEADISLVQSGDTVRIKAWGFSDREIPGKVIAIAPAADKRNYGMVVRVKATISNEDGALRSGMTGYAKVDGQRMMVWQAFLRFLVRFFQVEVWSWIP